MNRFALPALALCVLLTWMLQHPYDGIVHDSCLYVLLALERIHPATLSTDVFVRFGSQDAYTVFSPAFAVAIRLLGLDAAAALGTLLSQLVLFGGAWLLARRLMTARYALVVVGLLAALPSFYGAMTVFRYVEGFLTPRVMAEGLTLAALASWLGSRKIAAILLLLAAMLLHPIMACAGIVLLTLLDGVIPRPRLGLAALVIGFALVLATVALVSSGPFTRFDPEWLTRIKQTSRYLFVLEWQQDDWIRAALPSGALLVGLLASRTVLVRNLCCAALGMAVLGLAITLIFCDLLHIQLFAQIQAWRWLWLEQVLAIILVPVITRECWEAGLMARAAIVTCLAAWVFHNQPLVFAVLALALVCAIFARRAIDPRWPQPVYQGARGIFILALLFNFTAKLNEQPLTTGNSPAEQVSHWLQVWAGDGLLYVAVLLTVLWVSERSEKRGTPIVLVGLAALCACFASLTWRGWSASHYSEALYDAAAPWRAALSPHAEGLWPQVPLGAWYLLERPSYWSLYQAAGDIFSRAKALEGARREALLQAAMEAPLSDASRQTDAPLTEPQGVAVNTLGIDAHNLPRICADPQLDFVVSWGKLGITRFPPITPDPQRPNSRLQLYRCVDFRK